MIHARRVLTVAVGLLLLGGMISAQGEVEPSPKKKHYVERATLGASLRAPSRKEMKELDLKFEVRTRGQIVTDIEKKGASARAGIEVGDVIVRLDDNEIFSQDDIADFLRASKPGRKVEVLVQRADTAEQETVEVALGTEREGKRGNHRDNRQTTRIGLHGSVLPPWLRNVADGNASAAVGLRNMAILPHDRRAAEPNASAGRVRASAQDSKHAPP